MNNFNPFEDPSNYKFNSNKDSKNISINDSIN
jgi:hypothetical protein